MSDAPYPVTVSASNTASGSLRVTASGVRYRAGADHKDLPRGTLVRVEVPLRPARIARIRLIEPATETTFDVEADFVAGGC